MSAPDLGADRRTGRLLPITGVAAGLMWLLARFVTDAIEDGTTHDIITDGPAAQRMILDHQANIWLEALGTFWLAALIVVFAAVIRHALADSIAATATFGAGVLLAVVLVLAGALTFAELAAAHHHDTDALTTLGYLAAFSYAWKGVGVGFFALAVGWGGRRTRSLPTWFTIVTFVLGGLAFISFGYVIFWALGAVWFALVGLVFRPALEAERAQQVPVSEVAPGT
jgi:hypothetical protein